MPIQKDRKFLKNISISGRSPIKEEQMIAWPDKKAPYIFSSGGVLLVGYKRYTGPQIGLTLTQ